MADVGVWLVGAAGNVAVCTAAGWTAVGRGLIEPIGMVTATSPLTELGLMSVQGCVLGGHELRERSVAETARDLVAENVLPAAVIDGVADALVALQGNIVPGVTCENGSMAAYEQVLADLRAFRDAHELSRIVVLNVSSTEPPAPELPEDPKALLAAMGDGLAVPPSVIYAAAALELGCAFINFTPSEGSSGAALRSLAESRGAVHAGRDGKTGETLVKTALAPMFEVRRLQVQSWFSQNVLGNHDGRALSDEATRSSKLRSKEASLPSILGYAPENHVGIDYMPGFGDWKVAWDHIRFRGFGGVPMTMEFTWRGCDTALAAPLCIDLIRLTEHAMRSGERGVLSHLAVFFKDPMSCGEQRLGEQWRDFLAHYGSRYLEAGSQNECEAESA